MIMMKPLCKSRLQNKDIVMSLFSSNDEGFHAPFVLNGQETINQIETSRLDPENEYGNVEYKLRLTDPNPDRIERLVTQLKWRIREGHGEAIVFLGVKDDGLFVGLTQEEISLSLRTLEQMSSKIGAKMTVVKERVIESSDQPLDDQDIENMINTGKKPKCRHSVSKEKSYKKIAQTSSNCINRSLPQAQKNDDQANDSLKRNKVYTKGSRKVIQVLVKKKTHNIPEELRVAVLGPTESGKSSLLGVLSHSEYDNGRGSARLNLFRHRHEIRSGHTSSISQEIFGLSDKGQPLTYRTCLTTEEIIESSSRIVTLIDLAGHQRYMSTTLFGLGSHSPHLVLIVVNALTTVTNITTDYISLALAMEIPLAIVVNKIDLTSEESQESCCNELTNALQQLNSSMRTTKVTNLNDAIIAATKLDNQDILPIFFTSCVTGVGFDFLYTFFNQIHSRIDAKDQLKSSVESIEIQVDEKFDVPGVGTVVSGLVIEGVIREGDEMLLGPDDQGQFATISIVSLQRHKIPCTYAKAGQKCAMAIVVNNFRARKGMVMREIDPQWRQNFSICLEFEACVKFINDERPRIGGGNLVHAYVGNVKQPCTVISVNQNASDKSETFLIGLRLTKRPEYIRENSRIIIRYGLSKGIGRVRSVKRLYDNISPE